MRDLTIGKVTVRRDENGLFRLNDLHKASGGEKRHAPGLFMENRTTQEMISVLEDHLLDDSKSLIFSDIGNPISEKINNLRVVNIINSFTEEQGTYVVKELVYAYAMWISPEFHIKVIRAYDDMTNGRIKSEPPRLAKLDALTVERMTRATTQVIRLAKQSAREADPFVKKQSLSALKQLCHATGIEFADPKLIGQRVINDPPIVDKFWQVFDSINRGPDQPCNHSCSPNNEISIRLDQMYQHFQQIGVSLPERRDLMVMLTKNTRYPYLFSGSVYSRHWKKTIRCLVFKRA